MRDTTPKASYLIGLDLGQTSDPTALGILERPPYDPKKGGPDLPVYSLRHLQRFPLGTSYLSIVEDVATLTAKAPLAGACSLVIDQTGVGRPVVELFRRRGLGCSVVPVTITSGRAVRQEDNGDFHVAKIELVGALQVLFQSHRLKVARDMPGVEVLVKELQNFKVKITAAANEVYEAWREGQHDDLVLATALAAWWAPRGGRAWVPSVDPSPSLWDERPRSPNPYLPEECFEDEVRGDGIDWGRFQP